MNMLRKQLQQLANLLADRRLQPDKLLQRDRFVAVPRIMLYQRLFTAIQNSIEYSITRVIEMRGELNKELDACYSLVTLPNLSGTSMQHILFYNQLVLRMGIYNV